MSLVIGIALLLSFAAVVDVGAQITLPTRYDGFVYKKKAVALDSILIEAFFDPVCPDSRDSWGPLKQAIDHYGHHVISLIVHPFPLPYHDNAFVTSRALHIVNRLNTSSTYDLLDHFFKNQEQFYNQETVNMSKASIVSKVVKFATKSVGNSLLSDIESGFDDRATDLKTRTSFKYGCSRGVFGTPFFFVNGFALPDGGSPLDYKGWRNVIDPLIRKQRADPARPRRDETLHFF